MNDTPRADTNGVVATIHRDGYWTNKMPEQDPFHYLSQHGPIEVCPASELAVALEENAKLAAKVAEYESTDLCGPGGPCKALASSYAALAERDAELADERKRHDQTAKEGMDERDERKRLESALAESERKGERLKFHAEAMAHYTDCYASKWPDSGANYTLEAYRAEFKE